MLVLVSGLCTFVFVGYVLFTVIWPLVNRWEAKDGKTFMPGLPLRSPFGTTFDMFTHEGGAEDFSLQNSKKFKGTYQAWHGMKPILMIASSEDAKTFYSDQPDHKKPKDLGYGYPFPVLLGEALGVQYGAEWTRMRAMFDRAFGHQMVEVFSLHFAKMAHNWLMSITPNNSLSDSFTIDIFDSVVLLPFRALAKVVYGVDVGSKDMLELEELNKLHQLLVSAALQSKICKLPLYKYLPTSLNSMVREYARRWRHFNLVTAPTIAKDNTLFGMTVSYLKRGEMTELQYTQTLDEILFTNIDVTSAVLSWLLVHIGMFQDVQEKVKAEILDKCYNKDKVFKQELFDEYCFDRSSYLHAVVEESSRVQHIVCTSFPETTVKDTVYSGYIVPAGTMASLDLLAVNRSHHNWGETNGDFRPERFMNLKSHQFRYQATRFGMGSRQCPGKGYADVILKTVIVQVLSSFNISCGSHTRTEGQRHYLNASPPLKQNKAFLTPHVQMFFEAAQ